MPLPPLDDPAAPSERLAGVARAVPISAFLFSTLLAFNAAQTASLALRPVSRPTFRQFNRWAADTWWGWCVQSAELFYNAGFSVTGDDVPARENAIVLVNHQQMADIPFLMAYARAKDRLGDLKWFAKEAIKYVPGVGWGMWFLDCPFLKRDWARDRGSIEETFRALVEDRVPMWLISFPEGTRMTPSKLQASQAFAASRDITPLQHVLAPRTKGFVASVIGLRSHVAAVYDVTIGYDRGVPTLWQYMKGYARSAHLHVRRYAIESLPLDDEGLSAWLVDRFVEKDALLDAFYRTGRFQTT